MKVQAAFVLCAMVIVIWLPADLIGGEIKLDGILGQSQSADTPADFMSLNGVAVDHDGHIWTASNNFIYCFRVVGESGVEIIKRFENPYNIYTPERTTLYGDGEQLFFRGINNTIFTFAPDTEIINIKPAFKLPDGKRRRWVIAPNGMIKNFGARGNFFYSDDCNQLIAVTSDGKKTEVVFRYPPPPSGAKWQYSGFGFEPESGDLLIYSDYPDYRVYRYSIDGNMIRTGNWPRSAICFGISIAGNRAWALHNQAIELPPELLKPESARRITSGYSSSYPTGLAELPDSRHLVLADIHGLNFYPADGTTPIARVGGIPDCTVMAIDPGGMILAAVNNGEYFAKIMLDDLPNSPIAGGGNEPWRTGGQWTRFAAGLAPLGDETFLVLDKTSARLWKFIPAMDKEIKKAWIPLTPNETFPNAAALTMNDKYFYVLSDGKIVTGKNSNYTAITATDIPADGVKYIAACGTDKLVTVTTDTVSLYRHDSDSNFSLIWRKSGPCSISGLASDAEKIIITDNKYLSCTILSPADGSIIAKIDHNKIPGKFSPRGASVQGNFIVIGDPQGKRLLRLRFMP